MFWHLEFTKRLFETWLLVAAWEGAPWKAWMGLLLCGSQAHKDFQL